MRTVITHLKDITMLFVGDMTLLQHNQQLAINNQQYRVVKFHLHPLLNDQQIQEVIVEPE